MTPNRVKAFTLFELLVVVSIIGIVYSLFTQKLNISKKAQSVTLKTFIPWVLKQPFENEASIICLFDEKEEGCRLYLDNKLQENIKLKFFKTYDEVKVFSINNKYFDNIDFLPFVEEDGTQSDVFFKFDILVNGGHKTTVLQKNDVFYFYNSYARALKFDSQSDIRDYLWNQKKLLNDK